MNEITQKWTTIQNIRSLLDKKWQKGGFLREYIQPNGLFPLRLPIKGPSSSQAGDYYKEVWKWVQNYKDSVVLKCFGIEWQTINHRLLGKNEFPRALKIESLKDVVVFLKKKKEFENFTGITKIILDNFPQLKPWILKNIFTVFDIESEIDQIIRVVKWIVDNPVSSIYLRQLSIENVDTKFVEKHKKIISEWLNILLDPCYINSEYTGIKGFEKRYGFLSKPELIRFRILDKKKYVNSNFSDLAVRADELKKWEPGIDTVFITENDINGLTFPEIKNAIVVFGRGYGFESLTKINWIRRKRVLYWGDIDTHGFAILNQFRKYFPGTESLLMDRETLVAHKKLWVKESTQICSELAYLSNEEQELYSDLKNNSYGTGIRLEQESIDYEFFLKRVQDTRCL